MASRRVPLGFGVNVNTPSPLDSDPNRAMQRSNELSTKTFSRHLPPEFVPELDVEEWKHYPSDLPPAGEAGTAQQQMNCRRVLQVLRYDAVARRMAGVK